MDQSGCLNELCFNEGDNDSKWHYLKVIFGEVTWFLSTSNQCWVRRPLIHTSDWETEEYTATGQRLIDFANNKFMLHIFETPEPCGITPIINYRYPASAHKHRTNSITWVIQNVGKPYYTYSRRLSKHLEKKFWYYTILFFSLSDLKTAIKFRNITIIICLAGDPCHPKGRVAILTGPARESNHQRLTWSVTHATTMHLYMVSALVTPVTTLDWSPG